MQRPGDNSYRHNVLAVATEGALISQYHCDPVWILTNECDSARQGYIWKIMAGENSRGNYSRRLNCTSESLLYDAIVRKCPDL